MPSANPKVEKQASSEAVDPIRQTITAIEHKIRNLEKRKGKLQSYKDIQRIGGELNGDQKTAVYKYDEVQQTLDITRDLLKQIVAIANDSAKAQKKMARKEAAEKVQQDISKVREVLIIQDTLMNMGTETVREDFLAGINGAVKISDEDLKHLDNLYNEMMIKHQREEGDPPFFQQVQKVAEHYVALVDGKQREIAGCTYQKMKEILTSISQCGYFDQTHEAEVINTPETAETHIKPQPRNPGTTEFNNGDRHIPLSEPMVPMTPFSVQVTSLPVVSAAGSIPVVGQPTAGSVIPTEPSYYTNAVYGPLPPSQQQSQIQQTQQQISNQTQGINDVIGSPNFYFLQESELDAQDVTQTSAVVGHVPQVGNSPIPTQTFTNQQFSGTPVASQHVMYQHSSQHEISHMTGLATANPPPPIPMPPSHQTPSIPFSPQHSSSQQQVMSPMPQQMQSETFDHITHQQDVVICRNEETTEKSADENLVKDTDLSPTNESVDWVPRSDGASGDWNHQTDTTRSVSEIRQYDSPHVWSDQQSSCRGRGGRRGISNSYNTRGRGSGNGGYQMNGRNGNGPGSYYQNGYQRNNWGNNDGGTAYSSGFKRGSGGGPRGTGGSRSERNIDRGGRGAGQFRGGQRGATRSNYAARGKTLAQ